MSSRLPHQQQLPQQSRSSENSHPQPQPPQPPVAATPAPNCAVVAVKDGDGVVYQTLEDLRAELSVDESILADDFAIFHDVDRALQSTREKKLFNLVQRAHAVITDLQERDQRNQRKINGLIQQNATCLKNMSSIYQTALHEIERKNGLIQSLQSQLDAIAQNNQLKYQGNHPNTSSQPPTKNSTEGNPNRNHIRHQNNRNPTQHNQTNPPNQNLPPPPNQPHDQHPPKVQQQQQHHHHHHHHQHHTDGRDRNRDYHRHQHPYPPQQHQQEQQQYPR